jgi:hypothetical protein
MRWFIAAAVLCVLVIWAQIAIITKPEHEKQVAPAPKPVEAPLTPPKETAIVAPSPAPSPPAAPAAVPEPAPAKVAETTKDVPTHLQTSVAAPSAPEAGDVPSSRLAASVQSELKRLGCYYGSIDNDWNRSTRRALRRFARRASVQIDDSEATAQTLATLRGYETNEDCRALTASGRPRTQTTSTENNAGAQPESAAGQPAGKDDAYLPPWMRNQPGAASKHSSNSGTGTEPTPSASPGDTVDAPVAEPAAPKPEKKRRRHHGGGDPFSAIGRALGL